MTREQMLNLKVGDVLHYSPACKFEVGPRGGVTEKVEQWRVNGRVKTWVRDPNRIEVPLKHGLRACWTMNLEAAADFHLYYECPNLKKAAAHQEAREKAKADERVTYFCGACHAMLPHASIRECPNCGATMKRGPANYLGHQPTAEVIVRPRTALDFGTKCNAGTGELHDAEFVMVVRAHGQDSIIRFCKKHLEEAAQEIHDALCGR